MLRWLSVLDLASRSTSVYPTWDAGEVAGDAVLHRVYVIFLVVECWLSDWAQTLSGDGINHFVFTRMLIYYDIVRRSSGKSTAPEAGDHVLLERSASSTRAPRPDRVGQTWHHRLGLVADVKSRTIITGNCSFPVTCHSFTRVAGAT